MKKYYPLFVVEFYLIITLLLFLFGPIEFKYHNGHLFFLLIVSYHLAFIFGYRISTITFRVRSNEIDNEYLISRKKFFLLLIAAYASVFISYKNLMLVSDFSVANFFADVLRGISDPGTVYSERMDVLASGAYQGSRFLNVLSIFFVFSKFLFIFYSVYYWGLLRNIEKFLFFVFLIFYVAPGISAGVNSMNFYLFLFIFPSVFIKLYINGNFRALRKVIWFSIFIFFILLLFFGRHMSLRGGGFDYFLTISALNDISISIETPDIESMWGYIIYSVVWLISYVVQGYYGFSLALGENWDWTYGFGSSAFLQNQLLQIAGVDVSVLTFQSKISNFWDKDAQWHSFYAQIANDVGFLGVVFVMFFLGYLLSRAWLECLFKKNFYASALLPILCILFVFIPANNQIFSSIETVSYFFAILFFWALKKFKRKKYHGI